MTEALLLAGLTGSGVGICLLLLKNKLLKLVGGRFLYFTCLAAILLFVLPISFQNISFSVPQPKSSAMPQNVNYEQHGEANEASQTETAPMETEAQTEPAAPILQENTLYAGKNHPITVSEMIFLIWLFGFFIALLRYFIAYHRFQKRVCATYTGKKEGHLRLVKSELVSSPMLLGFFKPTLVLPQQEMDVKEYELALRHEMIHYKRHDAWLKLGAVIINAVHWFNPVPYFLVKLIGEACEYACDEALTRKMTLGECREYSEMILNLVCQSSPALSSNMAKNKKQLYRRFEMIMNKKKCNRGLCTACLCLLLSLFCGSAVLANEILPALTSGLSDYIYVEVGYHDFQRFTPVQKNGEYFLPLREVLNACGIENDKIVYDLSDSSITVDIWTKELKTVSIIGGENQNREEKVVRTAHPSWKTSLLIGSKEVDIGGQKHSLRVAPYKDDGITYVPYEYFKLLQNYENTEDTKNFDMTTNYFSILQMYGLNPLKNEYFCDFISLDSLANEQEDMIALATKNESATISKTGFRTEFSLQADYQDKNSAKHAGHVTVELNRVTRIFSKGSDIEGLFTVAIDGKTIYENEKGYLNNLPTPAGEGTAHFDVTTVSVGGFLARTWFRGWMGFSEDEYSSKSERNSHLRQSPDASYRLLIPEEVKLNGHSVSQAGNNNFVWRNGEYGGCNFDFYDSYSRGTYHMDNLEETEIVPLDENSFSLHCYFSDNHCRIDSFDAIITLLPNDRFEFRSVDGNYIIKGSTDAYTYLWERSPEEKTNIAVEMTEE